MRFRQTVICATVNHLPTRLKLRAEVICCNLLNVDPGDTSYRLEQVTNSGDTVVPCDNCMDRKITTTLLLNSLYLSSDSKRVYICGDIEIVCDGSNGHSSQTEIIVDLCIDV